MLPYNLPACKALAERRYRRNRCILFYRQPVHIGGSPGRPGSASSRLEQLVRIEQDGDGAVVFRGDEHIGAEPAVLRLKAAAAALLQELLIQRQKE